MKLTLGKKLGLGFGVILALMVFSATMSYLKSSEMKESQDRALDIHFPTLEAAKDLQRDLNQTQSKGRQAILAGAQADRKDAAKKLFDGAWGEIEKDVAAMDEFAPKWTLQANRDHLDEIKKQLPLLRAAQEAAMTMRRAATAMLSVRREMNLPTRLRWPRRPSRHPSEA